MTKPDLAPTSPPTSPPRGPGATRDDLAPPAPSPTGRGEVSEPPPPRPNQFAPKRGTVPIQSNRNHHPKETT